MIRIIPSQDNLSIDLSEKFNKIKVEYLCPYCEISDFIGDISFDGDHTFHVSAVRLGCPKCQNKICGKIIDELKKIDGKFNYTISQYNHGL